MTFTILCAWLATSTAAQAPTLTAHFARTIATHMGDARDAVFTPDGQYLATSSVDSTVKLWHVPDGALVRTLRHPGAVASIDISRDGGWLASGGYDGTVRLWHLSDGTLTRTFAGHGATVWTVKFSPDGERLASGGEDRNLRLWRVSDGAPLRTLSGHSLNVWSVAWSVDGKHVASGSFDRTVKIWNTGSGALVRTFSGHTQAVVGIAISPDGHLLASGGDDASIRIWRMSDGGLIRAIGVGNHNYKVAFSPDGQFIAGASRARGALGTVWHDMFGGRFSGANGTTVRIWRVSDGELQQALAGHSDSAWNLAFSSNGTWLASSSLDNTVILWRLERR